mgnify:FL=1
MPSGSSSSRNPVQHTVVAQQPQRSTAVRNQPHITDYEPYRYNSRVCRCACPIRHGDAWTPRSSGERYDGIARRGLRGQRLTWEDAMHRILDALGKDSAYSDEQERVWPQVFNEETVRLLQQTNLNGDWSLQRGLCRFGVDHDAIWHGRVNPKRVEILPPPETPGLVMIGPHGGYRPGPTESVNGTRLQGRPTTLVPTWGASQTNREGIECTG